MVAMNPARVQAFTTLRSGPIGPSCPTTPPCNCAPWHSRQSLYDKIYSPYWGVGPCAGAGQLADIGDDRPGIVIAELARIGQRHDDQPAPVGADAVANGAEDFAVRPLFQQPRGREVRRYKGAEARRKIFADVEASGQRSGSGMACPAKAVGNRFAAADLFAVGFDI